MNSPRPIAVLDGCLFPSQAVQPQAVTAQDTSVESMQDTEGEAGLEVAGMEKCQQETHRQTFTWREAGSEQQPNSPAPNLPTKSQFSVSPSVHEGSWGIGSTRLTVAFPQTPNHGRCTWLRCLGLMGAVGGRDFGLFGVSMDRKGKWEHAGCPGVHASLN